jgi:methionyl-tRNA formyltransferase
MKVTIACSDARHPVNDWLTRWQSNNSWQHDICIVRRLSDLTGGDILFLVSFHERVDRQVRQRYRATLLLHASELPKGRGWSPHIWRIIEGKNDVVVTLLEAVDEIDAGPIWAQERVMLEGHELYDEINAALFDAELRLMDVALRRFGEIKPTAQAGEPTYYRRRTPDDSRVDPYASIADQFDLLRVCDPVRYPAFFELRGHRYRLMLEKMEEGKQ